MSDDCNAGLPLNAVNAATSVKGIVPRAISRAVPRWRAFTLSGLGGTEQSGGQDRLDDMELGRREVFTNRRMLPTFRWLLVPLVFVLLPLVVYMRRIHSVRA